jgi:predicted nucleic acid-binding Zn ribbon protein
VSNKSSNNNKLKQANKEKTASQNTQKGTTVSSNSITYRQSRKRKLKIRFYLLLALWIVGLAVAIYFISNK